MKPKFTPDAMSIILFGPGVIEVTKAYSTSPASISETIIPSTLSSPRAAHPYLRYNPVCVVSVDKKDVNCALSRILGPL